MNERRIMTKDEFLRCARTRMGKSGLVLLVAGILAGVVGGFILMTLLAGDPKDRALLRPLSAGLLAGGLAIALVGNYLWYRAARRLITSADVVEPPPRGVPMEGSVAGLVKTVTILLVVGAALALVLGLAGAMSWPTAGLLIGFDVLVLAAGVLGRNRLPGITRRP